jgi:hypothetical protein
MCVAREFSYSTELLGLVTINISTTQANLLSVLVVNLRNWIIFTVGELHS